MPFLYYYDQLIIIISPFVIFFALLGVYCERGFRLSYYQDEGKYKAVKLFLHLSIMGLCASIMFKWSVSSDVFLEMLNTSEFPQNIKGTWEWVVFIVYMTIFTLQFLFLIYKIFELLGYGIIIAFRLKVKKEKLVVKEYGFSAFLIKENGKPDVGVKANLLDKSGNAVAQYISSSNGIITCITGNGKYKLVFEKSESGIEREDEIIYNGFSGMLMKIKDRFKAVFKSNAKKGV